MKFGVSDTDWALIQRLFVRSFAHVKTAELWLFGSRSRGTQALFSDIDLLVRGEGVLKNDVTLFQEALDDSSLPYLCDVVFQPELAQEYQEKVENEKVLLFRSEPQKP
ncbi:MAG: nucleotidyltransferase domain-containing protein [Silvanigrellales bacterium]|nr:nucleotidyltransferase domain-containing protein [Silvanigrellales bacterium]